MSTADINVNVDNKSKTNASISTDKALSIVLGKVINKIDASFENTSQMDISLSSDQELTIDLGYAGGECKVLYDTTEHWNSKPGLFSKVGYIYIYSDARQTAQGIDIPAFKVGDGRHYLIDMPFTDELYLEHVNDEDRHITQEERDFWNDKVRCYVDPNDPTRLIFTTE